MEHKFSHAKVNNSGTFSTFMMLCKHQLYLVPKYFHHLQTKPSLPSPPSPWQPVFCFVSLWIYLFLTII